ncbi:MAG: hypothetical protein KDC34_12130, partial [Saprospiraceae bacterium]|nr:hypothetical protein [Saprospiraceae bacterium]
SAFFFLASIPQGKTQPSDFGIGVQLGSPTGLSLHFAAQNSPSYDLLLAWDLNDYLFANLHFMYQKAFSGTPDFHWFYGPGVFGGIEGDWSGPKKNLEGKLYLGVSGTIGLGYYFDQFQIYARITPRLQLLEKTSGGFGGGLGFRFYL